MTDLEVFNDLCLKNGFAHMTTPIYSTETNELNGYAVWLDVGHVEFDLSGKLTNIVNY